MDTNCQSNSQQTLWKDVETAKEKQSNYRRFQLGALIGALVILSLVLSIFSVRHFWTQSTGKVYDLQYKVLIDGEERDSLMEIDSANRIEVFRTGNGSEEVLEIHDFKNGITGIRFAKHQKCYIRTQTKELPNVTELESGDAVGLDEDITAIEFEDSQVWVPAEEAIENRAFLLDSKIFEACETLPIHWIHPSSLKDAEFHDIEDVELSKDDEAREDSALLAKPNGNRKARDIADHLPVNDYRENEVELDSRLDERGICCQYCRRGYRFCQRYYEPLHGYMPYPYYYQGGRVICRIVMPCNWWIARMLGRV
ncbi:tenomodulin isoform X2 [Polyodon spathula]|uniref:tenomodulin isoform X2 n=1 Tax=Polyodon spathula TaxID=7913 RepID=UPI001B7F2755|nr:tenomodulin isoform X2 [Polyodon spathula]